MSQSLSPIIPQIPVEDLAIHLARAKIGLGDAVEAEVLNDKDVGIFATVWQPIFGILPRWRRRYIGKIGPLGREILLPLLNEGIPLRLRVVLLTPEHLAAPNPAEMMISIWADPQVVAPFLGINDYRIA